MTLWLINHLIDNQIIILQTKAYSDPGKLLTGHDLSVYKEKRALLTLIKNY